MWILGSPNIFWTTCVCMYIHNLRLFLYKEAVHLEIDQLVERDTFLICHY